MLRLLADQDFDHRIFRGLLAELSDVEATTALGIGLDTQPDSLLLEWAVDHDAILLTQDAKTMHLSATDRFASGLAIARVVVVPRSMPIGAAVAELLLLLTCGEPNDWVNGLVRLPLS